MGFQIENGEEAEGKEEESRQRQGRENKLIWLFQTFVIIKNFISERKKTGKDNKFSIRRHEIFKTWLKVKNNIVNPTKNAFDPFLNEVRLERLKELIQKAKRTIQCCGMLTQSPVHGPTVKSNIRLQVFS